MYLLFQSLRRSHSQPEPRPVANLMSSSTVTVSHSSISGQSVTHYNPLILLNPARTIDVYGLTLVLLGLCIWFNPCAARTIDVYGLTLVLLGPYMYMV